MKRVTYLLKDAYGTVHARMTLPEEENVSLEPWMVHHINHRGWRLEAWEAVDLGVQIHGWADWHGVAETMATVLRSLLDHGEEWTEDEEAALMEQARSALDDFHVAEMEVSVAEPDAEVQREGDDDGE